MTSMQFLNNGIIPLGALTAGTFATTLGLRPTMWLMTAGVGLAWLFLLIGPLKNHRDFPSRGDGPDAPRRPATQAGPAHNRRRRPSP